MNRKSLALIPARYGSTRFPGKALAMLGGKPIIQHVWERVRLSKADAVLVAVDDMRVFNAVKAFGGEAVMTSPDHPSGSDRIWEAASNSDADILINVQGDEPFVRPEVINSLIETMSGDDRPDIATVVVKCRRDEIADNPNIVKAVLASDGRALYFSRSMIPFLRTGGTDADVYRHWGIYAYTRESLGKFVSLPESGLEKCEKLEQLRALENGMVIKAVKTGFQSIGIDTPDELAKAVEYLNNLNSRKEEQ